MTTFTITFSRRRAGTCCYAPTTVDHTVEYDARDRASLDDRIIEILTTGVDPATGIIHAPTPDRAIVTPV